VDATVKGHDFVVDAVPLDRIQDWFTLIESTGFQYPWPAQGNESPVTGNLIDPF